MVFSGLIVVLVAIVVRVARQGNERQEEQKGKQIT